mmetsp:Transcript_72939/g.173750  ORF Transcript_72939/g.173750 Transcript_72939/m.173750 type:complete len:667 (+) Transcript_72939:78-2078(+)
MAKVHLILCIWAALHAAADVDAASAELPTDEDDPESEDYGAAWAVTPEERGQCPGAYFKNTCISCDRDRCKATPVQSAASAGQCCKACMEASSCEFWTFYGKSGTCYHQSGQPTDRRLNATCVSGIPPADVPVPKPEPAPKDAKNVLFFIVDDLRPEIGAYGASYMHTPHMDKLAAEGVLFQRAYIQYAFCAPSRNSFMSGRRPDQTESWSFTGHFREEGIGNKWSSMPQYFKDHGYLTLGTGKIYHPALPPAFDAQLSWDEYTTSMGMCRSSIHGWPDVFDSNVSNVKCVYSATDCYADAIVEGEPGKWCKLDTSKMGGKRLADQQTVHHSKKYLQMAKEQEKPFFLAVGFHKPHLPFAFPQEFDVYPHAKDIKPPQHSYPPEGMPKCAWKESKMGNAWNEPLTDHQSSVYRKAYYAATTFTDHNIGMVLQELEALGLSNDTVVALIGDHGWHLGENNLWQKQTNFEMAARVPLIFRVPWAQGGQAGVKTTALVEAVDLFPTFTELAGLKDPRKENLPGKSFASLLATPPTSGTGPKQYSFTQFAKSYTFSKETGQNELWGICTACQRGDIDVMGYSVREENWRFTAWVTWDKSAWAPIWDKVVALELYNHKGDYGEDFDKSSPTRNEAYDPEQSQVVKALSEVLKQQFPGVSEPSLLAETVVTV